MNITVHFFSISKEIAGKSEMNISLPGGATIDMLLNTLCQEIPRLREIQVSCMFAIGLDYASTESFINDGDIISVIPPVQGG